MVLREEHARLAWMDEREIAIIDEILRKRKPLRCLEWGSGFSTVYFSRWLLSGASWLSIEHDEEWAGKVREMLKAKPVLWRKNESEIVRYCWRRGLMWLGPLLDKGKIEVAYVAPNQYPWTDEWQDGSYFDLKDYVEHPSKQGPFDFVLVDGRARRECLRKAHELVTDNGVVLLHDAKRNYYRDFCEMYQYQEEFIDDQQEGFGLWIGSKNLPIETALDVPHMKSLYGDRS